MSEGEAKILEPLGQRALTGEQAGIGEFTVNETKKRGRRGHKGWASQGRSEGRGEFGVCNWVGRGDVEGTGRVVAIEQEKDGPDGVVEGDPTHPLAAVAEFATEAHLEYGQH